ESIRLPDAFWCYDPQTSEPGVAALPGLKTGRVTFGSLNTFCKVNGPVLKLWAHVLQAVENSRLLLHAPEGRHRQDSLDVLNQEGVMPERVTFVDRMPRSQYLQLYHQIDI